MSISTCLNPDSGVSPQAMHQLCAEKLVPLIEAFCIEASTGQRLYSHVEATLNRLVKETDTTLCSSQQFMTALCVSLHSLACKRWCNDDGIVHTSDEKSPQLEQICAAVRKTILDYCALAAAHSHGARIAALWCQVGVRFSQHGASWALCLFLGSADDCESSVPPAFPLVS